jgi:hypothetical protein
MNQATCFVNRSPKGTFNRGHSVMRDVVVGAISNSAYREFRATVNAQPDSLSRVMRDRRHVVFPLDAHRTAAVLAPSAAQRKDAS